MVDAAGADRVGTRTSPWDLFQGMCQTDPHPQYSHAVGKMKKRKLAYLCLIEFRINGIDDTKATGSLDFLIDIWGRTSPILLCGGFNAESALRAVKSNAERADVVVLFSWWFVSNPDLPFRIQGGIPFNPYHREDFCHASSAVVYIDQPFSREFMETRVQA